MEDLCTFRELCFFSPIRLSISCVSLNVGAASHAASLAPRLTIVTIRLRVNILKFQETIHGRSYVIEVRPVGQDRWRAQIARLPGATTALMPFYGATPEAAAQSLSVWLNQAGAFSPS